MTFVVIFLSKNFLVTALHHKIQHSFQVKNQNVQSSWDSTDSGPDLKLQVTLFLPRLASFVPP